MSNKGTQASTVPLRDPGLVPAEWRYAPGELFGGREAWRPRREIQPEGDTTRLIKLSVLVGLFLCYLTAGVMLLHTRVKVASLGGILALVFAPPLFAILVTLITAWILFPAAAMSTVNSYGSSKR
jgi:hypothetical protein